MRKYVLESQVENIAHEKFEQAHSGQNNIEKIKKIVVPDFDILGKLTALRFIEWCQLNPEGVVSLATGKTPKTFIKWVRFFIENWDDVWKELESWKIDTKSKPNFSKFTLVQMDEYFPMNCDDEKSFYSYINTNYVIGLGFSPEKCLLMNISQYMAEKSIDINSVFTNGNVDTHLMFQNPQNIREQTQSEILSLIAKFASDFELKINELGGLGFFLGGIGPDGHIAFNFKGSAHSSLTRLLPINYESAAAAASIFGGIEFVRNKAALTIGLGTITQNPTTTAIILADGVGKANVVKNAIESVPLPMFPATALHSLQGSRVYLTKSSASKLKTQQYHELKNAEEFSHDWGQNILVDIAIEQKKHLHKIKPQDIKQSFFGDLFINNGINLEKFIPDTTEILKNKIARGCQNYSNKVFLHTSPHSDDVALAYLPFVNQLIKDQTTSHFFTVMTSGANTVQNSYLKKLLNTLSLLLKNIVPLNPESETDLLNYISGIKQNNCDIKDKALASRLLRNIIKYLKINISDENLIKLVQNKIVAIKTVLDSNKSHELIVDLKRGVREMEENLVWKYFGVNSSNIFHMNLGFYSSSDKSIVFDRDIQPIIDLFEKTKPDIVTVALDPMNGGHPTHYLVKQIIAEALKKYASQKKIEIWGYNNVWFKFNLGQSNLFFPVSVDELKLISTLFTSCYKSQLNAAVPSPEYDGPFCDLMQKILQDQKNMLQQCLGKTFFTQNKNFKISNAVGFGFIKTMTVEEFLQTLI